LGDFLPYVQGLTKIGMKIDADKIVSGPSHTLTAQHIRIILNTVPPNWITGIKKVRLSNSLEWRGTGFAFFSR